MKLTEHLTAAGAVIAEQIPDGLMVAGAAVVSYGVGLIYPPAGWIALGVFLLAGGVLLAKGSR